MGESVSAMQIGIYGVDCSAVKTNTWPVPGLLNGRGQWHSQTRRLLQCSFPPWRPRSRTCRQLRLPDLSVRRFDANPSEFSQRGIPGPLEKSVRRHRSRWHRPRRLGKHRNCRCQGCLSPPARRSAASSRRFGRTRTLGVPRRANHDRASRNGNRIAEVVSGDRAGLLQLSRLAPARSRLGEHVGLPRTRVSAPCAYDDGHP